MSEVSRFDLVLAAQKARWQVERAGATAGASDTIYAQVFAAALKGAGDE